MADVHPEQSQPSIRTQADVKADGSSIQLLRRNVVLFIRDAWFDILLLVILAGACAVVWVSPHAFNRLFPITHFSTTNTVVNPDVAYPYVPPPLNSTAVALVCALIPTFTILLFQLQLHSFTDAACAILGLVYALVVGTLFQVTLKKTIGGLRPLFLAVCEPVLPVDPWVQGRGFQSLMFTVDQVCTGDKARIQNAMESFPSGHAQIAFAGLGYLAVYLWAHTRVFAAGLGKGVKLGRGARGWIGLGVWRMPVVMAPLLLATYVSASLVLSYNHHYYDVLAGGFIGCFVAVFAYRMVFESVLDGDGNFVTRWTVHGGGGDAGGKDLRRGADDGVDGNEADVGLPR